MTRLAFIVIWLSFFLSTRCHYAKQILQAPGEAEAELAYLNQHGFIDAVVTNDSDTFVFGAKCVLKRCACCDLCVALLILVFILVLSIPTASTWSRSTKSRTYQVHHIP